MFTPRVMAILAVYFGLAVAGPLAVRQECGGTWECQTFVDSVPECSKACIANAAKEVGCGATDFECRCKNKGPISDLATPCVLASSCTTDEFIATLNATNNLCPCVDKNGPPPAECPAASSSLVVSSSTSAKPAPSSVAPSGTTSEEPAPSSAAPSVEPSSSASAIPAPSVTGKPKPSASKTGKPKPKPTCSRASTKPAAPAPAPTGSPSTPGTPTPPGPAPGPWECTPFVDAIHDCSKSCIAGGAAEVGCDATDFVCRCANAAKISELVIECVLESCGVETGLEVREQTAELCSCVASNPPIEARGYETGEVPEEEDEEDCIPAPPVDDDEDDYPTKPEQPVVTPPKVDEPTVTKPVEPPVVTAGAAKQMVGSGAAALLALVAIL